MSRIKILVITFLASTFSFLGLSSAYSSTPEYFNDLSKITESDPLYFGEAIEILGEEILMGQHYSHMSHRSHVSHTSHRSHVSHYSSRW